MKDAQDDPEFDEEPNLQGQSFDVTIACANPNDPYGEAAFLGAGRVAGNENASPGKGLLEIEEQLFANINSLGESSGIRIFSRGKGAGEGTPHPQLGYVATRTYRFEAELGAVRFYHRASGMTIAVPGGGAANLSWVLAPSRFDYYQQILRRIAGSTPTTSPTGGTGLVLGGAPDGVTAVSKNDTPGAGTWSYSLFTVYREYGSSGASQYSAPLTKTVVAT